MVSYSFVQNLQSSLTKFTILKLFSFRILSLFKIYKLLKKSLRHVCLATDQIDRLTVGNFIACWLLNPPEPLLWCFKRGFRLDTPLKYIHEILCSGFSSTLCNHYKFRNGFCQPIFQDYKRTFLGACCISHVVKQLSLQNNKSCLKMFD